MGEVSSVYLFIEANIDMYQQCPWAIDFDFDWDTNYNYSLPRNNKEDVRPVNTCFHMLQNYHKRITNPQKLKYNFLKEKKNGKKNKPQKNLE